VKKNCQPELVEGGLPLRVTGFDKLSLIHCRKLYHHIDHFIFYKDDLLRRFAFQPFGLTPTPLLQEKELEDYCEDCVLFILRRWSIRKAVSLSLSKAGYSETRRLRQTQPDTLLIFISPH